MKLKISKKKGSAMVFNNNMNHYSREPHILFNDEVTMTNTDGNIKYVTWDRHRMHKYKTLHFKSSMMNNKY